MSAQVSGLWIPDHRKDEVGKRLAPVKRIERRKGRCLFVVDEDGRTCGNPVYNNCHVIPESTVLEELKDDSSGKVYEFRWGVSQWGHFFLKSSAANPFNVTDPDAFEPPSVGTGDACVGWFACKHNAADHDGKFSSIDVKEPDFDNPIARFLSVYRVFLYEVDLCRLGMKLLEGWNRKAQTHQDREIRVEWNKLRGILRTRTQKAEATASHLGKTWHRWKTHGEFDSDTVSGQVLCFRSKLKFAACGLYGGGVVVTVFPVGEDGHKVGILHLSEDADSAAGDEEKLVRLSEVSMESGNYGVDVVEELMTNGWGTIASSPESYSGLHVEEKRTLQSLVARNSAANTMARALASPRPQYKGWRHRR